MLFFLKREVHRCDFLQFVVHFYSQVLLTESFNFNFSSQYTLLAFTLCNTNKPGSAPCPMPIIEYGTTLLYFTYLCIKRKFLGKCFQKLEIKHDRQANRQTDRRTDRQTQATALPLARGSAARIKQCNDPCELSFRRQIQQFIPLDMCSTFATFFITLSILVSVVSISREKSSNILNDRTTSRLLFVLW